MTEQETRDYKEKLEGEKSLLEQELQTIGRKNPANPADWEATGLGLDAIPADENEVADTIEEYETNTAIVKQLETRLNEVTHALNKIEKGIYGICEISNEPIEKERLDANPAARTNIANMGKETNL